MAHLSVDFNCPLFLFYYHIFVLLLIIFFPLIINRRRIMSDFRKLWIVWCPFGRWPRYFAFSLPSSALFPACNSQEWGKDLEKLLKFLCFSYVPFVTIPVLIPVLLAFLPYFSSLLVSLFLSQSLSLLQIPSQVVHVSTFFIVLGELEKLGKDFCPRLEGWRGDLEIRS